MEDKEIKIENEPVATLTIVRGLPGSGKSTKAKELNQYHVEADMFRMRGGKYVFRDEDTKKSHAWCASLVFQALAYGVDVVVSNTFTQLWEFAGYIRFCKQHNIPVRVIRCVGNYGNIHDVPQEVYEKMRKRFEDYEGEEIVV